MSNDSSVNDRTEELRKILEQEQGRTVEYAEALEVGESLLNFFGTLMDGDEATKQESLTPQESQQTLFIN